MKAAVATLLLTATLAAPAAFANIKVWTEKDRQGDGKEMRGAVRDLKHFNFDDRISSLEADEPWEVCSEPLYRGDCRIVQGVVPNLRTLGLNNRITSMRKASEEMIADLAKPPAPEPRPTKRAAAVPAEPAPRKAERAAAQQETAGALPPTEWRKAKPEPESPAPEPPTTQRAAAVPAEPAPRKAERAAAEQEIAGALPPTEWRRAKPEPESPPPEPPTMERSAAVPPETASPKQEIAASAPPRTESLQAEPEPPAPTPSAAKVQETTTEPPNRTPPKKTAPPAEPAPVSREWWEGGDDSAGGPPALEVFEKPNFEGRKLRLDQPVADLTDLDQPVGSLLVRAGSWKICSKPRFRGRCRTVDATGMGVPEAPLIGSLRPETE